MTIENMNDDGTCAITILEKAADALERDGWVRGMLHYGQSHCALGAIDKAVHDLGLVENDWEDGMSHPCGVKAIDLFAKTLVEEGRATARLNRHSPTKYTIHTWNDRVARDKKMVVRALRRAARKARGASK